MKDIIKRLFGSDNQIESKREISSEVIEFSKAFFKEALEYRDGYSIKLTDIPKYKELKKMAPSFRKEFVFELIYLKNGQSKTGWGDDAYFLKDTAKSVLSLLIRASDIHFDDDDISDIVNGFVLGDSGSLNSWNWPVVPLVGKIEKEVKKSGLSPELSDTLSILQKAVTKGNYLSADEIRLGTRVSNIGKNSSEFEIDRNDPLGTSIYETITSLKESDQEVLKELLEHFSKGGGKSAPANTWLKTSNDLITKIGVDKIKPGFIKWIEVTLDLFREIHKNQQYEFDFIADKNIQILRSAVWSCSTINDDELNQIIEVLGLLSFKKLRNVGALSAKLGNGCIYTFSKLPYQDGISRLTKFRMKIKYPSVQSIITKAIERVAKAEGKTMYEIEELAVQDLGLNSDFQLIQKFGEYEASTTIESSSGFSLLWENESGKKIKSIPKYVKDNFAVELKEYKKKVKDIQSNLTAQRSRIEKIFLAKREWDFEQWKKLYLDNNLLRFFGTKLIWSFTIGDKTTSVIYKNNEFIDVNGVILKNYTNAKIKLWHPVNASVSEVQSWRRWLEKNEIKQPFKQAHRELYIVTDAEKNTNTYSNRFAAHVLRQHIFIALCRERGWAYTLQGQWDSHNTPVLKILAWKYRVEFWVEGIQDSANDSGIFNYLQTDQVRFFDEESQVEMDKVPAIVFSEAMRDIDLFVGVTSIGADPNWRDGGEERYHGYWADFSFGNLAVSGQERKELLENLIPKLKIANQCSFEGNFLVVKGDIRIYKIHLGSGNILMKPNDQYLCIVADRSKSANEVFLPFEGDATLSVILSKAFMLADDTKIKDRTIISQIKS
ncbi:DUF4132 domain-containing protein [Maribacter sp. BPC-D8]|uniref:DUF4132 domain-containing protein n=1 Tax=Maribacter sp. BPC-D8 TaxID=3053613 RepID=UPI002B48F3FF|nr:DUF4132 domain-containing protein [Maribacter sp. BPC-D8]WRI29977.1 DUF4132 domain-containing protein [Maribacter sp. BPC-D8]